jgi:hypothetical protein
MLLRLNHSKISFLQGVVKWKNYLTFGKGIDKIKRNEKRTKAGLMLKEVQNELP